MYPCYHSFHQASVKGAIVIPVFYPYRIQPRPEETLRFASSSHEDKNLLSTSPRPQLLSLFFFLLFQWSTHNLISIHFNFFFSSIFLMCRTRASCLYLPSSVSVKPGHNCTEHQKRIRSMVPLMRSPSTIPPNQ